jgi:fermentation-respiration switch protein FrsA (DUF1100 family)
MDDATAVHQLPMPVPATAPQRARILRRRLGRLVKKPRAAALAPLNAACRLANLYVAQTRLIFPGRATQGKPSAVVRPSSGTEVVRLRTSCKQDVFALFGTATDAHGRPLPDAATRPTLLYFYGNKQYLACPTLRHLADGLRRMGVNVMVPEYVGYGMSTGDAGEAGCYATADAAYQHLVGRRDVDPRKVVVAGASLGGAVAIDLASREAGVAGLVTLITFTSMPDMAKVVQPSLPIWRFIRHKFESEQKMRRVTCPTLIVHSTGDELVPYTMADRLAAACAGPVSRVKIEGAATAASRCSKAVRASSMKR